MLYHAVAVAGAGLVSEPAAARAAQAAQSRASGLATGEPRSIAYEELEGFLGREQLRWHHESHYQGALRGFRALDADPTQSHRSRVAKANSVVLHELYFDNMTARKTSPGEATRAAIEERFGSLERWSEDFAAAARACTGWGVLAYHPLNGKLYNTASDSHDDGPAWFGVPLVVVDVYEHAYYLDFQDRKAAYVDAFVAHVDWDEVERRLGLCLR